MDESSTHRWFYLTVLICLLSSTVWSQAGPSSDAAGAGTPSDDALSRMEKSIAQQQAAIESFRDQAGNASWREQRESVVRQVGVRPEQSQSPAGQATGGAKPEPGNSAQSAAFFTVPWPGSLPLTMPNVQVAGETCDPLGKSEVDKLVRSAAMKHDVAPDLLRAVMKQESAFKPCALSVAGAMGLMQIMPETADLVGLKDPFDPEQNVDAGAKFLKMMLERFGGDVALALGAYNAGPEAVAKAGGVPPIAETLQYVSNILGEMPIAY